MKNLMRFHGKYMKNFSFKPLSLFLPFLFFYNFFPGLIFSPAPYMAIRIEKTWTQYQYQAFILAIWR